MLSTRSEKPLLADIKPGSLKLKDFLAASPTENKNSTVKKDFLELTKTDDKKIQLRFSYTEVINSTAPTHKFAATLLGQNKEVVGFMEFSNGVIKDGKVFAKQMVDKKH